MMLEKIEWENVSWAITDLSPYQQEIIKILCENNLYPMRGEDVVEWLKRRGHPRASRASVAVVIGRMREILRDKSFVIATRHGPGGGYSLRPRR